jgi:hypothetical protein
LGYWAKFCPGLTIADEKDQFGIPVARVTFNLHDNDKKLIEFGKNKVMELMSAAGAEEVVQEPRYAHLVGGARMVRTGAVPLWISLTAPMTSPTSLSVWKHPSDSRLCQSGAYHPSACGKNGGLFNFAVPNDFQLRPERSLPTSDPAFSLTSEDARSWCSASGSDQTKICELAVFGICGFTERADRKRDVGPFPQRWPKR